jgi:hypothetical protein
MYIFLFFVFHFPPFFLFFLEGLVSGYFPNKIFFVVFLLGLEQSFGPGCTEAHDGMGCAISFIHSGRGSVGHTPGG